jgi:hypothetical protein
MKNHTLNLFKVSNITSLDFSYKLVAFDLPYTEGKEDLYNKQLQKIAEKVSSATGGPAAILKREGKFHVVIPADKHLPDGKVDVTPFIVDVKMLPGIHHINMNQVNEGNIDVVQKFLEFEIRSQLSENPQLWKMNASQFFFKKPLLSSEESTIEIFDGFTYRLVQLSDGFYICLDLATKYIDKYYLSHYVNAGNVNIVGTRFRHRRTLYQNGDNWYTAEIEGFGKPIKQHEFNRNGQTYNVFDYITQKTRNHRFSTTKLLRPEDLTMLYTYPGRSMQEHNGASSLAKIIYGPGDAEVRALHRYSIKKPSPRFEAICRDIKNHFQAVTFNGQKLIISTKPLIEQVRNFRMPELKFNNDQVLKVGHYSTGGNTGLREFNSERKQYICDNGILNKSGFDEQFLIVPEYLDKELVAAFKKNAEWQISKLAPAFSGFKVLRYKVKENQPATFQIQELEKLLQQQNALSGFALFILPDATYDSKRYVKTFHDCLKSKFYPGLKVQCASAFKIKSFFQSFQGSGSNGLHEFRVPEDKKPKFRSYIFNLVMEYLIVNRKWPYALAQNGHYDIYIGIDVHDRYAGITFFFKNGEEIFFAYEPVPKKNRSQRAEKLKASLLIKVIYERLKIYIPKYAVNPNGIVIIRDGRSFGEEEKALISVVNSLASECLVNKDAIKYGVVDLYKQSSIPFRLASLTNGHDRLENPVAGAYRLITNREGFIFNTGYPFQLEGSAKPLHLSLKAGNVDFMKVMEDVFCQSMLAFSAPDRSNSLPVTLKLIDTLLEPLSTVVEIAAEEEEYDAENIS